MSKPKPPGPGSSIEEQRAYNLKYGRDSKPPEPEEVVMPPEPEEVKSRDFLNEEWPPEEKTPVPKKKTTKKRKTKKRAS